LHTEGPSPRARNVLSVLMQCFAITCVASLIWLLCGYSLAFTEANGFIGSFDKVLFAGITEDSMSGSIPETLFALFQMTFAVITPALIFGGFAERVRFGAVMLFSSLWLLLVYIPVTHWVWGPGGWLAERGLLDFAGGTVVHITAGVVCFYATQLIKLRLGIDDSLDVFPVHGVGGIMGTLLVGIFASSGLGVFSGQGYAEGMTMGSQLGVQLLGVLVTFAYTAVLTWGLLKLTNAITGFRVSPEEENTGLDIVLHDERGYDL
jgi:Amt family ammonium transporter